MNNHFLVTAILTISSDYINIDNLIDNIKNQTLYKKNELQVIIITDIESESHISIFYKSLLNQHDISIFLAQKNESLLNATNRAIRQSDCEFITKIDLNYKYHNDYFERLASSLQNNNEACLTYSNTIVTHHKNQNFNNPIVSGCFIWPRIDRYELFNKYSTQLKPMWRKSLHEQYGYFDDSFKSEGDYEFWLRLAASGARFHHIPDCLALCELPHENEEQSDHSLSFSESELARIRHWNPEWGPRPTPSGTNFVPMQVKWSSYASNQSKNALVSVIIPTKDRPLMLREALESVLNQSYQNVEAVVINDAGCDVQHIIDSIPNSHRITYLNLLKNTERSRARNCGISLSKGDYIAYLDDDDIFYNNHIETLLNCATLSNHKIVYSDSILAQQYNNNGIYKTYKKSIQYSSDFNLEKLYVDNYIPILCLMHEKKCLDQSGYFDTKISTHEDWDLWISLSKYYSFLHINKVTSEFRMRDDKSNTSNSKFPKFLQTYKYIYNKYPIPSNFSESTSLQRKKSLFTITLTTYDFLCNLISETKTNDNELYKFSKLIDQCGATENQLISASIYLKSINETNISSQRQLLLRAIKSDHENYHAWISLCNNYVEDRHFKFVENILKTLIQENPLEMTLYDSLINIYKILNNEIMLLNTMKMKQYIHNYASN